MNEVIPLPFFGATMYLILGRHNILEHERNSWSENSLVAKLESDAEVLGTPIGAPLVAAFVFQLTWPQ